MVAKFTESPWSVKWGTDKDGDPYFDIVKQDGDADDNGRMIDASYSIVEMAYPVIDEDEAKANGHLIAAAPDLYTALDRLLEVARDIAAEQCSDGENVAYWNRRTGEGWRAVRNAESALAYARGEDVRHDD